MTINDVIPGSKAFPETTVLDEKAIGERRYVVASPYTEAEHLLDLETLDAENQILGEALVDLKCLRDDYATAAYADTFNWDEVVGRVRELAAARNHGWRETSWYIVAFRSRYEQGIDYSHLGELDKAAHAEATASGGFLKYVSSLSLTHSLTHSHTLSLLFHSLAHTPNDPISPFSRPCHRV